MNHQPSKVLEALGACSDCFEYVKTQPTLEDAWVNCQRGDWMLWFAVRCKENRKSVVAAICEIAESLLPLYEQHFPSERSPHKAVELAKDWIDDKASTEAVSFAAADSYRLCSEAPSCGVREIPYVAYIAASNAYQHNNTAFSAASVAADVESFLASNSFSFSSREKYLARYADIVRKHIPACPAVGEMAV